ncbi:c-type cytochrome [Adhaeribacter sp. BT258]|uniref:C-type cytochrome n=1 Tax=Adhaeribacter terrigena TaxID=2793070 RepID=A0ABS1BWH7_9BACT|nr:cytochrome c peroxidase [Adhaeribacter terrigena]MBK0401487.1 c-type cytochrome [Adhaeribacter terrigena]
MRFSVLLSGIILICCCSWLAFTHKQPASPEGRTITGQFSTTLGLTPEQELGKQLFFDANLSNPVGQSCASCHAPAKAFADPQHRAVSAGAAPGVLGNRNASAIAYAAFTPPLYFDTTEAHYVGGFFWDGRASSLAEQAMGPLLNHVEMNANAELVARRIQQANYRPLFEQVYGAQVLDDPEKTLNSLGKAIAAFETTTAFQPFTSKFDYVRQNKATFTEQELLGLKLFNDPKKGNCAACHPSEPDARTGKVLFTDFTYDNIGAPVNLEIKKRLQDKYQPDLGLGKVVKNAEENGKFKVPTLRNVALTAPYFHNGVIKTLEESVQFYNQRDSGKFGKPEIPQNVNHEELGDLKLTDQEVKAIVAFMHTLTDGYQPE